jgi:TonB family protein
MKQLGKVATIAGISLGIASTFSACSTTPPNSGNKVYGTSIPSNRECIEDVGLNSSTPPVLLLPEFIIKGILLPGLIEDITPDVIENIPLSENIDISTSAINAIDSVEQIIKDSTEVVIDDIDDYFFGVIMETLPEYPGGDEARLKFLRDNVVYPKEAREKRIEGTVYVNFIVGKDGSISNVKVARGIGGGCDEEAVRVVSMMPNWKPGKQRGKEVRVSYNMPVKFTLGKD